MHANRNIYIENDFSDISKIEYAGKERLFQFVSLVKNIHIMNIFPEIPIIITTEYYLLHNNVVQWLFKDMIDTYR